MVVVGAVVAAVDFAIVERCTAADAQLFLARLSAKLMAGFGFTVAILQRRLIGCQEWCTISSFQQIPQSDTIVRCFVQHYRGDCLV